MLGQAAVDAGLGLGQVGQGADVMHGDAELRHDRRDHVVEGRHAAVVDDAGHAPGAQVPLHPGQGKVVEALAPDEVGAAEGGGIHQHVGAGGPVGGNFLLEELGTQAEQMVAQVGRAHHQQLHPLVHAHEQGGQGAGGSEVGADGVGGAHFLAQDGQALGGFGPGRVGGEVLGHLEPGDVVPGLDDEVGHVGRAVVGEQDVLAAEELGLLAHVEQAPDVVVAEPAVHAQLAFGHVLAPAVVVALGHAQFPGALVQQIAEHRDAWRFGAVDGGHQDVQGGHAGAPSRTDLIRSMIILPAAMPSAAQPSAPTRWYRVSSKR